MDSLIEKRIAGVVVVDHSSSRRGMLCDVLREHGFSRLNPLPSGKDLISYLEVETPDLILMPYQAGDGVNALQVLRLLLQKSRFFHIRVSLFVTQDERELLPLAFEMGLMSALGVVYTRDELNKQIASLLSLYATFGWNGSLVAAHYLREYLLEKRCFSQLRGLYHQLIDLYPGNPMLVLKLAEIQLMEGRIDEGIVTLHQAELLSPMLKSSIDSLRQRFLNDDSSDDLPLNDSDFNPAKDHSSIKTNVLGISSCVVVDPDSTVLYAVENLLRDAGVPEIFCFTSGKTAWEWLRSNPAPGLVLQEWRLPELTGPLFVQRLRQEPSLSQVPVIVISSLVKKGEVALIQEMGVSAVIEKPFDEETFFRTVVSTLQQQRRPTEQVTLERRIRQLLELPQLGEALRLIAQYESDPNIRSESKTIIRAELAFHQGDYLVARDLALEALKQLGDSLLLLNLLGKCFLKTGNSEAALKCFGRAQAMSPVNLERLCRMAEAEVNRGDASAAQAYLKKAKDIDPQNSAVLTAEAGLALAGGDSARASTVIAQLESVGKLLAFMNNRAIALTLSGRFEDGIDLYRHTIDALPLPWGRTQDAVLYNLSLAYARYGDLKQSAEALKRMRQPPGTVLAKKAERLAARVAEASRSGNALALSMPATTAAAADDDAPVAKASQSDLIKAALEIRRGDACLNLIYRSMEFTTKLGMEALKEAPHFVERLGR